MAKIFINRTPKAIILDLPGKGSTFAHPNLPLILTDEEAKCTDVQVQIGQGILRAELQDAQEEKVDG